MIDIEKQYTDNPFVDNLIYYTKYLALNSVVKDNDEALNNETVDTLRSGDLYISCIEGRTKYELFPSIPVEVLENYITKVSNIDMYAENYTKLHGYILSLGTYKARMVLDKLTRLARTIYIDHYEVMVNYLSDLGPTWLEDNRDLYNSCVDGTATYNELFNSIPNVTVKNILTTYINNYNGMSINLISKSLNNFKIYVASRSDTSIEKELEFISKAMRDCFKDHYDIMQLRKYIKEDEITDPTEYVHIESLYEKCKNGLATFLDLYNTFPYRKLKNLLIYNLGESQVTSYRLSEDINNLEYYFDNISTNKNIEIDNLNENMRKEYIETYNMSLNYHTYERCKYNNISLKELFQYIPIETLKYIISTEVPERSNLDIYAEDKSELNRYLSTLPKEESEAIKQAINIEMRKYYIANYVEGNNYYRTYIGLPPIINGKKCIDTLAKTYDTKTDSFIDFGEKFINMIPKGIYPDSHWKSELCEFDSYDIGILNEYGILDAYKEACGGSNTTRYRYLDYLGDNKLDLYTCRKASEFQIIGCPIIDDEDIRKLYIDKYTINRDYVLRTVYDNAYKYQSDYYNKFIIIFIVINTIMDLLGTIGETILNREVFDSRCIRALFESYGIPYYSEIPVKYQRAMLRNLNILIKYKSSTKNMIDICNLFGFSDIRVFGYYLFKQRIVDANTGNYIFNVSSDIHYDLDKLYVKDHSGTVKDYSGVRFTKLLEYRNYSEDKYLKTIKVKNENGDIIEKKIIRNDAEVYIRDEKYNDFIPLLETDYFQKIHANVDEAELKFIKVPIDDDLAEYKNDDEYLSNYDEIVVGEDTWDGGLEHEYLREKILDYEFNAVKSKYISVETVTHMTELSFQVSYFYNMLFDNAYNEEHLTLEIPYLRIGHKFKFLDVVCYLFALMYLYNNMEDNIMYSPTQMLYIKGYNFDEDLNTVLKDALAFSQNVDPMEVENIFDINEAINKVGYNYKEAFKEYKIKAFNLQADIDALDEWLMTNYQLSLDDFIVDDSLTTFNHVLTLRHFFSLNNSYYQKSIFTGNSLVPIQFNQEIKYAYDIELFKKIREKDLNGREREFIKESDGYYDIIDRENEFVYIPVYDKYGIFRNDNYCLYNKRKIGSNQLMDTLEDYMYYTYIDNSFSRIVDGEIFILDKNKNIIFAADKYYTKINDEYQEITDPMFYYKDRYNNTILNLGDYYELLENGMYDLKQDNCYVIVIKNGVKEYVLVKNLAEYQNMSISTDNCYVRHSDGHFVSLFDSDFFVRDTETEMVYKEEDCYVRTTEETEYYDESVTPRVYYKKLTDYYDENNYVIYDTERFVKDPYGKYISESSLVRPDNCYYIADNGLYDLVYDNMWIIESGNILTKNITPKYHLIIRDDNNYDRYLNNYLRNNPNKTYVRNSDEDYITALINNVDSYTDTNKLVVIFNRDILEEEEIIVNEYNPDDDGRWDENDWFYNDPSYDEESGIGMNGENVWYYKKPGASYDDNTKEETEFVPIGTGFYIPAESYLGSTKLSKGGKYYISFDVETNFTGNIQIACDADSECVDVTSRIYNAVANEQFHVSQIFIANEVESPRIRFLIYDDGSHNIENGDYIIISNISFIKAYSDNYIAQDIPSYDKLQELYRTNEAIYKYLVTLMNECSDMKTYEIYRKLYECLMLSSYNKEAFKLDNGTYAKTYTDFLQTRDSVLYDKLTYFKSLDSDTMHKEIADNIIEVTYAIDDCVDTYSYGYLYSYFPAVSASYIQQYISKIINFFKSWKVHLLGINTIYKFDDESENTIKILEDQSYYNILVPRDNVYISHDVKINPLDSTNILGQKYTTLFPDMEQFTNKYKDKVSIGESVKIIREYGNRIEYYDTNSKLLVILNDGEITIDIDGNELVTNTNELSTMGNELIYTPEGEYTVYEIIENISKYSKTIVLEENNNE